MNRVLLTLFFYLSMAVHASFAAAGAFPARVQMIVQSELDKETQSFRFRMSISHPVKFLRIFFETDEHSFYGARYLLRDLRVSYMVENGELYSYSGGGGNWAWAAKKRIPINIVNDWINIVVSRKELGNTSFIRAIVQFDSSQDVSATQSLYFASRSGWLNQFLSNIGSSGRSRKSGGRVIQIDYYGDSTIQGGIGGTGNVYPRTAPSVMAEHLPGNYVVKNEGTGGGTIADMLAGQDGIHPAWDNCLSTSPAKYVIINYALNDPYKGATLDSYRKDYEKAIEIAQKYGKVVILETPNPSHDGELTERYANVIRQLAVERKIPLIDQYQYLSHYMMDHGLGVKDITSDGVHPTQATYVLKGEYAARRFKEIMRIK